MMSESNNCFMEPLYADINNNNHNSLLVVYLVHSIYKQIINLNIITANEIQNVFKLCAIEKTV